MNKTIFKQVDYDLGGLIADIELGRLGLPDIQRPFVWPNVKVRDLFDSMYRGYPIGYLLLWENGTAGGHKAIGLGEKQMVPNVVIVDGQQRLTSVYAVFKGKPVVRDNWKAERIRIAFNPLERKFEVASAATRQDRAFIPDISVFWSDESDLFQLAEDYTKGLRDTRELAEEDTRTIRASLTRLQSLSSFRMTALQLSADISEEDVAEVFVRINSQGKTLNQADFILTLMSVFWEDGRTALERFCRQAQQPSGGGPSPFNHFIKPSPDQLLRVAAGLAFRRARLSAIYSVLRGKDLETGEFRDDAREQQFARLKDAQQRTLDLKNWHGFMHCLQQAGFRTESMINSKIALIYTYLLYLIGRTELRVPEHDLRGAIARWFFMAALTGRYTGSSESAMESDLSMLRDCEDADEFLRHLSGAEAIALTSDFWEVTLPNELATPAARSPSLAAFNASLIVLDAPVLFSATSIRDWWDPATASSKSIERHHLFPKAFLAKSGSPNRHINQIANYAYVEWQDNAAIADKSPAEYVPLITAAFSDEEVGRMYRLNAIPNGWEQMPYDEFLKVRRTLMAHTIREGYQQLKSGPVADEPVALDLAPIIAAGEADRVEFKATLRTNLHTGEKDARMENAVVKTIAGFLNTHGGTLIVGVADNGDPVGIDADGFANEDKMSLHLTNLVNTRIGETAWTAIHANFDDHDGARVLVVRCEKARQPAYVADGRQQTFYVRTGAATMPLPTDRAVEYIKARFH